MSDYLFTKSLEPLYGHRILTTQEAIANATRNELVRYLESRGYACYDDEPTELLRETATEDWHNE